MLQRKKELLEYSKELVHIAKDCSGISDYAEKIDEHTLAIDEYIQKLIEAELCIPFIGGFSAGKSSAINALLGKGILPVDVKAETALPTEIRFSETEKIIAITKDGNKEEHPINAIGELSKQAHQYTALQLFLSSPVLKEIEPLTLVDMPGYDSTFEQHTNALCNYVSKGAYYFYMLDITFGTLTNKDLERLNEIQNIDKSFTVFLTKSDLKTPSDGEEVKGQVSEQLMDIMQDAPNVTLLKKDNVTQIIARLKEIEPNKLFNDHHLFKVRKLHYGIEGCINTLINSLNLRKDELKNEIDINKNNLLEIQEKQQRQIDEIENSPQSIYVSKISATVEAELNSRTTVLANKLKTGEALFNQALSEIVRPIMLRELKKVSSDMSHEIVQSMAEGINAQAIISPDVSQTIIAELKSLSLDWLTNANKQPTKEKKELPGLPPILVPTAHPVIQVVLAVLPSIVSWLFDSVADNKEQQSYENAIRAQVIPQVVSQIKDNLSTALATLAEGMVKKVTSEYTKKLEEQKQILASTEERQEEISANSDKLIAQFTTQKQHVSTLANKYKIL